MSGQVVQITINVTDGNAAEAVQQVVAQLNAIGPAGAVAGAEAGRGLDQVGEKSLSAKENVRLLSEEMGIHVPRAMQSVIAQSQILMAGISAIGPAMIAIGGIDILMHLGEQAYKLYENFVEMKGVISDSDAVIKSFGDSAAAAFKHASEEYVQFLRITKGAKIADQQSLEDFRSTAIKIPTYEKDEFKRAPDQVKGSLEAITGEAILPSDIDAAISKLKAYEEQQEKTLASVRAAKSNVVLGGQYSLPQLHRMAELEESIKQASALQNDLTGIKSDAGNTILAKQAQIDKDKPGTPEDQERLQKEKETQTALAALDEKALESQLSGIDLLEAQRRFADKQWVTDHGTSAKAAADIDEEYFQKELEYLKKQQDESKAKNDKILEAQRSFEQEVGQVGTRSEDAQVNGYARIADEAERAAKRIQDAFSKLKATPGISEQDIQDAQMLGVGATDDVHTNSLRQMAQLHTRTMEQIAKEEEQTARQSLAPWQQAALAIQDAWQDRTLAIKDDEDQQLANAKSNADAIAMIEIDADAKRAAAHQLMVAQMVQAEEEMRDKLAQGLESLFRNPAQFFEKRAMDTAFQLMANEMLSTFKSSTPTGGLLQYMFGMGPQMSTSTNPLTAMESAIGIGGHGAQGTSGPSMLQFQQGSTTLLTGSQALLAASTALQSAAGSIAAGGMGSIGGMGGGGGLLSGLAGGGTSNTGSGMDLGAMGGSQASAMMMPGLSTSPGMTGSLGSTFDNSLMQPGLNGIQMDSTLGGAASMGAKGLGAAAGVAGGGLMAGTSIYSAYQNSDPLGGLLGGAMGGMEAGAAIGSIIPGLGTVVGGAIGAIAGGLGGLFAGIFGDKGRGKARDLDSNTIQPTLAKDMQDYEAGRSGYNTLSSELNSMLISAQNQTQQLGSGARSYFNSNIQPEIQAVLSSLQKQERGGRSQITMSAAQYHSGGWTGDFGDMATSGNEGFIHAMANEFVVNPMAAAAHAPILQAMNSGTNFAYSNNVQPRMPSGSGGGATVALTIKALDSKDVATWAAAGGGLALMAALNQANRQYGGVGRG